MPTSKKTFNKWKGKIREQVLFECILAFWIKLCFSFKKIVASNIFFVYFKELSSNLIFCLLEI